MTDLYVLALRCDLVRTGTIMVGSGGDSFAYHGPGGSIAAFSPAEASQNSLGLKWNLGL